MGLVASTGSRDSTTAIGCGTLPVAQRSLSKSSIMRDSLFQKLLIVESANVMVLHLI
jgi:hypothetical protein